MIPGKEHEILKTKQGVNSTSRCGAGRVVLVTLDLTLLRAWLRAHRLFLEGFTGLKKAAKEQKGNITFCWENSNKAEILQLCTHP